jgi:hypothetical protein
VVGNHLPPGVTVIRKASSKEKDLGHSAGLPAGLSNDPWRSSPVRQLHLERGVTLVSAFVAKAGVTVVMPVVLGLRYTVNRLYDEDSPVVQHPYRFSSKVNAASCNNRPKDSRLLRSERARCGVHADEDDLINAMFKCAMTTGNLVSNA